MASLPVHNFLYQVYSEFKNNTQWREDMNFMFSWSRQNLTRSLRSLVRYCFYHSNIKFISSRQRLKYLSFFYFVRNSLNSCKSNEVSFFASAFSSSLLNDFTSALAKFLLHRSPSFNRPLVNVFSLVMARNDVIG